MSTPSQDDRKTVSTPEQLREQAEHTRQELGRTMPVLAAKADVKAHAKEQAAEIKAHAAERAALVTGQLWEKATRTAQLVKDKTPDPVLDRASHAAAQVRTTAARAGRLAAEKTPDPIREKADHTAILAGANRTPILVAAAGLIAFLLLRRSRRQP